MRWSSSHLPVLSSLLIPPWLVLVFVCASARSSSAAPAAASVTKTCGTQFTDTASSALLADIVLEGRVRDKVFFKDSNDIGNGGKNNNNNNPPHGRGDGATGVSGIYQTVVQVRKHIWKGKDLMKLSKRKKIKVGKFAPQADTGDDVSNVVSVRPAGSGRDGDDGADSCIGDVDDGATYIFFLRDVGDKKGNYFELSALPVKKNRREARIVSKILKTNGAKAPAIQRIKAPKSVTTGSSLTLRCKAKAKPNPVFQWFRNGKEIVSGRGQRIKNSKRGSRLKIAKAELDHAGVYVCVASNAVGEASKNITVKVGGLHYEPPDQTTRIQYTRGDTTVYDHYMNEDANSSADIYGRPLFFDLTAPQKIYKACEKQTYCFNGGTCRYISEMHQTFCECPAEWAGPRCERLDHHSLSDKYSREATLLYERTLIIIGIVIAVLVFVVICIASYCLANRRRKRFEAKRRLRRQQGPEADALLDKTDGHGGIPQPQFAPSYRPIAQKETQTDLVYHPPDFPPKREHESEPNFSHPNNIFLRDNSFPLMNAAPAAQPPPPPYLNGQRPKSDREPRGVERRGSRSRLKAVSVDDNCKDRPKSWKASEVPDSMSMPVIRAGQPEMFEMNNLPKSESSPGPGGPGQVREENPWQGADLLPPEADSPVRMQTQPKANASAQLKKPADQKDFEPAVLPTDTGDVTQPLLPTTNDVPFPSANWPESNPVNGVLQNSDSEEEAASPLPPLHISEEDLNGNVSKPSTQHEPDYRPKALPDSLLDGAYPHGFGVALSPGSQSEEDSTGFLPQALTNSEDASSSALASPLTETYAFDPGMDSDHNDFDDQFMHGSPKKTVYGGADDKQDYERRLRNVRTDQEPIPI